MVTCLGTLNAAFKVVGFQKSTCLIVCISNTLQLAGLQSHIGWYGMGGVSQSENGYKVTLYSMPCVILFCYLLSGVTIRA